MRRALHPKRPCAPKDAHRSHKHRDQKREDRLGVSVPTRIRRVDETLLTPWNRIDPLGIPGIAQVAGKLDLGVRSARGEGRLPHGGIGEEVVGEGVSQVESDCGVHRLEEVGHWGGVQVRGGGVFRYGEGAVGAATDGLVPG